MANKVFGTDFVNETSPQSTWTISANNGTVLKDVALGDILKVLAQLSGESSPANADSVLLWDASASEVNQVTLSNLFKGMYNDGWITAEETWTYSSADSPTFVISINADMTSKIAVGYRIKLTQTTAKYFIVTAVGTFSAGATLITVYGGTDYTLANATITLPYYSPAKAPLGFPVDPNKWSVTLSNSSNVSQSSPVGGTWYNLGSLSLSIPIGVWRVSFEAALEIDATLAAVGSRGFRATMSTANNSETDSELTASYTFSMPIITNGLARATIHREKFLVLASKTTYYLNANVGTATNSLAFRGDVLDTKVRCTCAYL